MAKRVWDSKGNGRLFNIENHDLKAVVSVPKKLLHKKNLIFNYFISIVFVIHINFHKINTTGEIMYIDLCLI